MEQEKKRGPLPVETAVRTILGGREEQQDRAEFCLTDDALLAVVCDGLGGCSFGGLASDAAVTAAVQCWKTQKNKSVPLRLKQVLETANEAVIRRIGTKKGGTTLVAAAISDGMLYWVSAGDSRLYIVRQGKMLQATRDHDYHLRLMELQKSGRITEEELQHEEQKGSALISYLGLEELLLYDLTERGLRLQPDDLLLLTTDGLYRALGTCSLQELLCSEGTVEEIADRLTKRLDLSLAPKLQDNSTFIVIRINHGGKHLV